MSAGITEENVQFQAIPIRLDKTETDPKKINLAIQQLAEYVTMLRNRVIELEAKVNG